MDQIEYLLKLSGPKRQAILRRLSNNKLKQEVDYKIKQKQKQDGINRFNKNWEFVKNWMIKHPCECGENNISKLSFHHLHPFTKENLIRRICGRNRYNIEKELKRGIVKCKNCHTIIHIGCPEKRENNLIGKYINSRPKKKRQI